MSQLDSSWNESAAVWKVPRTNLSSDIGDPGRDTNHPLRAPQTNVGRKFHIDITPPHTPLPVFRRIGKSTIPYSWRACKQLRHLCETALRSNGLFASMFDGFNCVNV
ncbi:uncharacterized protein TNCV_2450481 [Trichonephila clavipes]|nr:uncharacterized protein TNCV_2450481 [Trichonephila clavipes]